VSSYESSDAHRWSTADTVAGFLATLSIFRERDRPGLAPDAARSRSRF
jgi:hypothetical protein